MTNDQIINMMIEDLKNASAPERKAMAKANFPSSLDIMGVRAPDLQAIAKNWRAVLHDISIQRWIEICLQLNKKGIFECQQLTFELIWKNKKVLKDLTRHQVLELG